MSHIVGLDLSLTSAGVAVLSTVISTRYAEKGHQLEPVLLRCYGEDGSENATYQQRSRRVRRQIGGLRTVLKGFDIALAVIEGPIYAGKILPSYFDRAGLFHGVYGFLDAWNIPIAVIPNNTGHQFVTGRGRPVDKAKTDVVEETRKWWPGGPRVHNSDEGDALGLALMGAMHLGFKPPFRPGARHYHAIACAEWPK